MITSARIEAVKELGGIGWITCLRAPAIRKLAADDGPLQMSLLDQQDLTELSTRTAPTSASSPTAIPTWPPSAPACAKTSCRPQKSSSPRSPAR
jgi:hypothetical protein